jgi:hypothetical protein
MIPTIVPKPDCGVAEEGGVEVPHPVINAAARRASATPRAVVPNLQQPCVSRSLVATMCSFSSVVMVTLSETV